MLSLLVWPLWFLGIELAPLRVGAWLVGTCVAALAARYAARVAQHGAWVIRADAAVWRLALEHVGFLFRAAPLYARILVARWRDSAAMHEFNVVTGDAPSQRADVYFPPLANDRPTSGRAIVVFVYGGAWSTGDKLHYTLLGMWARSHGLVAVVPNYVLHPAGECADMVRDVSAALAWTHRYARAYGGDPARIHLVGHSAGGHLAALAVLAQIEAEAQGRRVGWRASALASVVTLAAPTDIAAHYAHECARGVAHISAMAAAMGGEDGRQWAAFSPTRRVGPARAFVTRMAALPAGPKRIPPFVLVHGVADTTVPISAADAFATELARARWPHRVERLGARVSHSDVVMALFSDTHSHHAQVAGLLLGVFAEPDKGAAVTEAWSRADESVAGEPLPLPPVLVPAQLPEPESPSVYFIEPAPASSSQPPVEYAALVAQAERELAGYSTDEGGWHVFSDTRGVRCSRRRRAGSALNVVRGESIVEASPDVILALLRATERRSEWDVLAVRADVLERWSDQWALIHIEYKGSGPVSARDVCLLAGWSRDTAGVVRVVSFSIAHPRCPPRAGFVRAHVHPSGYEIRPTGQAGASHVTYVTCVDLAGWLTPAIANYVADESAMSLRHVRRLARAASAGGGGGGGRGGDGDGGGGDGGGGGGAAHGNRTSCPRAETQAER